MKRYTVISASGGSVVIRTFRSLQEVEDIFPWPMSDELRDIVRHMGKNEARAVNADHDEQTMRFVFPRDPDHIAVDYVLLCEW